MNFNHKIEEKRKKYSNTKLITKYKNKLSASAHPFFPKENNQKKFVEKEIEDDMEKIEVTMPEDVNTQNNPEGDIQNKDNEKENNKIYSYEFLIGFGDLEISKDTYLLPEEVKEHINQLENYLSAMNMDKVLKNNQRSPSDSTLGICSTSRSSYSSVANIMSLEFWGRQDYTRETEEAENNKKIFDEINKKDAIKKELRELLNKMTKDNYDLVMAKILEIIKDKIENQDKFIDVIFLKSISEESYVGIYAKLCKDLDKELPQKIENKEKKKNKRVKKQTLFKKKLLDKCKEMLKYEENKKYEEYIKEDNEIEKEEKMKKIILGNSSFISELIKNKFLSKKAACESIEYLFEKYNKGDNQKIKWINIQLIIKFIDKLGTLIESEKEKKTKENIYSQETIKKAFEKLEEIKEDRNIPGHIKYSIINLIIKKENHYKQSELEKSRVAKSKKELEEQNKETEEQKSQEEKKEINQDDINDLIKNDLYEYKWLIESEGSSEKYSWNIITDLYDLKLKTLDSIIEGYFMGCQDFIENNDNLLYAKDYIKEVFEYYKERMEESEKKSLVHKIFDLYEIIKDIAFEIPKIFMIYEHVIELLIEQGIAGIKEFENIFEPKLRNEEDLKILNNMFRNIFNNIRNETYKNEFFELKVLNVHSN